MKKIVALSLAGLLAANVAHAGAVGRAGWLPAGFGAIGVGGAVAIGLATIVVVGVAASGGSSDSGSTHAD